MQKTEVLLDAMKEISVKVKPEESKNTLTARYHNASYNHDIVSSVLVTMDGVRIGDILIT